MNNWSSPSTRYEAWLWSASTTAQALGIGRRTLWGWVAQQRFPAPDLALGGRLRRWRRSTVLAWIEHNTRLAEQPNPEPLDQMQFPFATIKELPHENH